MLDPVRAKVRLVAFTAAAFTGGLVLASGMGWTTGSHAATLMQDAPSRQDVQPVADLSQAFIAISESVTPSVVSIEAERPASSSRRGQQIPEELRDMLGLGEGGQAAPMVSGGSGFIISPDGYVMTNNHVITQATKITVTLQDNRQVPARLVGTDPLTDVAVLKLEGGSHPAVRLGSSDRARIGEWVLAIGNPLDLGTTVTSGIISAKGRNLGIIGQTARSNWAIEDFIQTDAAINPGNSGGPLVNLRGEVIGINTLIASQTGYYSGYGFAIPIDLAQRIGDDLIRYGRVRRAALGVSVRDVTPEDAEQYRLAKISGVLVQDFEEESPGRRAGLQPGDVIVSVNGQAVEHTGELQRRITGHKPGETVTLGVYRNGRLQNFSVLLTEARIPSGTTAATGARGGEGPAGGGRTESVSSQKLGLSVAPLTQPLAQQYGYRAAGGVVITDVEPYGVAGRRGIPPGWKVVSVGGQAVTSPDQFRRLVDARRPGEIVSLVLEGPTGTKTIVNVRLAAQ